MEVAQGGGGCSPTQAKPHRHKELSGGRSPRERRSAAALPRGIEPRPPASILSRGAQLEGRTRTKRSARGPFGSAEAHKNSAQSEGGGVACTGLSHRMVCGPVVACPGGGLAPSPGSSRSKMSRTGCKTC